MESKVSGHWTDEKLVAYLYGIEPEDSHFARCDECQGRLAAVTAHRRAIDAASETDVSFELLAAQRRAIYAKLTQKSAWWSSAHVRRWASATAAVLVVGGGLLVYEGRQAHRTAQTSVSDAQLALDVSRMAQDAEPQSTAPLEALFE